MVEEEDGFRLNDIFDYYENKELLDDDDYSIMAFILIGEVTDALKEHSIPLAGTATLQKKTFELLLERYPFIDKAIFYVAVKRLLVGEYFYHIQDLYNILLERLVTEKGGIFIK